MNNRLYIRRWMDHFRNQVGILYHFFDGVVLLYIGVPSLLIFGRIYYGLWREELPIWLSNLPLYSVALILFVLFRVFGGIVFHIEEADVLILQQRPKWIHRLKHCGMIVGICKQFIFTTMCIALLAPILIRLYHFELLETLNLLMITVGMRMIYSLLTHLIRIYYFGWKRVVLVTASTSILGLIYVLVLLIDGHSIWATIISCISLVIAAMLVSRRLSLKGKFEAEIREDIRQRTLLTSVLLLGSVDKPAGAPRARPWLFPKGKRLLRSNAPSDVIAESIVKAFFRSRENMQLYVQIVIVGVIAILISSFPIKILVYGAMITLLSYWLNGYRSEFFNKSLLSFLNVQKNMEHLSISKSMTMLLLPAVIVFSIVCGGSWFHIWWAWIVPIPFAVPIAYFMGTKLWKYFSPVQHRRN